MLSNDAVVEFAAEERTIAATIPTVTRAEISSVRNAIADRGDVVGLERIIGNSDLVPIFLWERGLRISRTVARITVRDRFRREIGHATGFLISHDLLMTNWHVFNVEQIPLASEETAAFSLVEFDYQLDKDGHTLPSSLFETDPSRFYFEDQELDMAIIAVKPQGTRGEDVRQFGFNPIIAESGKVESGEYVSIIQHPKGMPKHVALRENQVVDLPGEDSKSLLFYRTDTEPGSSGSPVYNDQWYVAALHHKTVPGKDENGEVKWVANEGIRISAICRKLQDSRDRINNWGLIEQMLAMGETAIPGEPAGTALVVNPEAIDPLTLIEVRNEEFYRGRNADGYQTGFLSVKVDLPEIRADLQEQIAELTDGSGHVLKYTHFSVVMRKDRRLAFFTAVNIDGAAYKSIKRDSNKWYIDGRISEEFQSYDWMYKDGQTGVDRGHLVRREDPNWGDTAGQANDDTFHFTNCSPQYYSFNQQSWLALENFVLQTAKQQRMKVTVFTGPVMVSTDRTYRSLQVPAEFWKVVAWVTPSGELKSAAYLHSQKDLIGNLREVYGPFRTYQRPLSEIEALTGLTFGDLAGTDIYAPPSQGSRFNERELESSLPSEANGFLGLLG